KVPEVREKDTHRDARGACSRGSLKLPGRDERDRGRGRTNRPAQAPPKSAPKDRQRSPGQTALSTQGCTTAADKPGQSGPSLKLSRRSDGCQRFERVSRMSPKVHVVQSLNFPRVTSRGRRHAGCG